jgi:pheromone shutdown protein TraB
MAIGQIKIIGTSHVAQDSVNRVSEYIESHRPDIVAVELDARRAHALMHNVRH